MKDYVFEIKDKTYRLIHLSKKQWQHIIKSHPYMANLLDEIKKALMQPQKISDFTYDENVRYYYTYLKHINRVTKKLLVVVKYI